MEYEPYKEMVRSLVIQQLTQSGWVELIRIPIENPEELTPDNIQEAIESIHKLIYRANKLELSVQGVQLCIRELDTTGGTFRVCASNHCPDGPKFLV